MLHASGTITQLEDARQKQRTLAKIFEKGTLYVKFLLYFPPLVVDSRLQSKTENDSV